MPYSTGCKTPLSNFEAGQNYKIQDNAALVAWTTTPWILPSNLALCVNAKFVYLKIPWLGRSMNLCLITFSDFSSVTFRLVADDYVMNDSGTGIVHCAPVFGADDYRVCLENEIIKKIVRDFKRPDGLKDTEIDAAVDKDESLKNEGVAREVNKCNRSD
ncbi:Valyl/Leucyl/Isoleucyl-tRNA synthetase editing domain [Arabidopsis thaliana x Arabidopsis arenosa]|uniref:Valyl/Leucyl/Isoleucyl-tRNA synthetase editing domain n=1 Tax=Arabidopsis thaliana x Arabidopsis arenosa TaxID=1240361 RepID=A0A8T2ES61_9BRAS|nr:Valyl/Leucyl/Isoleucyl-tRNA synthetase editing domain [Arabidopsis thaliana x Arabidopsis arenosa]